VIIGTEQRRHMRRFGRAPRILEQQRIEQIRARRRLELQLSRDTRFVPFARTSNGTSRPAGCRSVHCCSTHPHTWRPRRSLTCCWPLALGGDIARRNDDYPHQLDGTIARRHGGKRKRGSRLAMGRAESAARRPDRRVLSAFGRLCRDAPVGTGATCYVRWQTGRLLLALVELMADPLAQLHVG
jgi:hypothetical protein